MIIERRDDLRDRLSAELNERQEELRGRLFNEERAKAKPKGLRIVSWSSIVVPPTATELEALTYVPGLVGDITEWIARSARRPNRIMALGVATVVVGTLIGPVCSWTNRKRNTPLTAPAP
jgi:hypothetical protein